MSGPDQGDDKGFLARWSQRKQEAKQPEREAPVADAEIAAAPATESEAAPEFDLSSLPSLDELTSETDITAFLRKGVPEHLRNAALRKSWALDPAIRNYVNPALDYAYDWNTPGGVPGNSELGAGIDVARMVTQIMGTGEAPAEQPVAVPKVPAEIANAPESSDDPKPDLPEQPLRLSAQAARSEQNSRGGDEAAGPQNGQKTDSQASHKASDSVAPQQAVRRHGSAKPVV
ncbi:DUF3306 domain-containing protein [Bradyrhizobium sp. LjRoot220]|uniref:DUF3306 domain-containing protein n=1 Tax=Bradyrhizobium sp. LjRoot220 TaxID=3342284 RepID=UPI003ED15A2C